MAKANYTQVQILNAILNHAEVCSDFDGIPSSEIVDFCAKKIAQAQNKSAKVNSQKIAEKEEFFEGIREVIGGQSLTASEVMKAYNAQFGTDYSLPKITNALTAMGEKGSGEIVRTMDKKVARFSLA